MGRVSVCVCCKSGMNGTLRGFSCLLLSMIYVVNPHTVKRGSVYVCWALLITQNACGDI